jgi:hypothetical protein
MTRILITTVLLSSGLALVAKGMCVSSTTMLAIGGLCIGFYNGMVLFGEKLKY